MNPSDYFREGSEGYLQTKQAIDVINAGRAAGIPGMDQYEQQLIASIAIAKQSGGKNWKGFDANRQAIAALAPQIEEKKKQKDEFAKTADQIKATLGLFQASGGQLNKPQIEAIQSAAESGDTTTLTAYNNLLFEQAKELAGRTLPLTPQEQAKLDIDAQKLAEAKQKAKLDEEQLANAKRAAAETLKEKYKTIVSIKNDPDIKSAFGVPIMRMVPGTERSSLSAKINQLSNQEWIDAIIKTKSAGASFGSLTENEGAKLASAATLLSSPSALNYETGNAELQKMAESVKKLYREATGGSLKEEVEAEAKKEEEEEEGASGAADFFNKHRTRRN